MMAFVDPSQDHHWYRQLGDMLIESDGKMNVNSLAKTMGVSRDQINSPTNKPGKGDALLIKSAGFWGHKRGLAELTVLDASGKFIVDPRDANRKYENVDYKQYVATFCINSNFGMGEKFSCK